MISDLKSCKTIYDLSSLLDIKPKHLTYLLYVLPEPSRYRSACLSKKNGKVRQILIPNDSLKQLQRRLSDVLYLCQADIDKLNGPRRSYGFERDRTIFDNAAQHVRKNWVFNIDLEDFFPSINFGRVIGYFSKNTHFSLDPKIATLVAQIACHDNQLPQGAPSSPVISNFIAGALDYRLSKLANKARCSYSRYADDITFSTNQRQFPSLLAIENGSNQGWQPSDELVARIANAGFKLNTGKTRMSYRRSRQTVTGLVVNDKPNVGRERYKEVRSAVHHIMRGKPWHIRRFDDSFFWNCENETPTVDEFSMLEGRLSFIHSVADRSDTRMADKKFFRPSAITRTYANFLYFKYFVRGSKPIILTEGVSDILYLKGASLWAKADVPGLAKYNPLAENDILSDFYNFPKTPGAIMGLTGGTGRLGLFLERYWFFSKKLSTNIQRRPFIILIDNDTGLEGVQKVVRQKYGIDISKSKNDPFYKLAPSTYIVKTPHKGKKKSTSSEDFLDPNAVSQKLGGKSFSAEPNYDKTKHFGKFILGSHLIENLEDYSFVGFDPIMHRIRDAISAG